MAGQELGYTALEQGQDPHDSKSTRNSLLGTIWQWSERVKIGASQAADLARAEIAILGLVHWYSLRTNRL